MFQRVKLQFVELSIIVPVYKEEGNVSEFLGRMARIRDALTESYEIIFALDPSPDRTEEAILNARAHDPRIKVHGFYSTRGAIPEHPPRAAIGEDEVLQPSKRKDPVLRS